jgi:PAS domain S-box-containing protein
MKKISGYLMAVVLIISSLTFMGWVLDIEFLKQPFDGNEMMNPLTALSMILACISFYLQCKIPYDTRTIILAKIFAFSVLSVAVLKLLALTGINVGVEHLLFKDKMLAESEKVTRSARLAIINSSIGFFITGTALLLTGMKGKWPGRLINILGLIGFIIGAFICIGFIYHINEFYGILPYMSVSPVTGLCFVVFAHAMMFENSDAGFMAELSSNYLGGKIARGLIPIGIGVPVLFGYIGLALSWWFPFSAALGTALLNTSIIIVFLIVLWFLARTLNHADAERQMAEMQLQRQAQLFTVIPDAVIYGNKDLTITNANPAAAQIFNIREEEIGRLTIDDIFEIEMNGVNRDTVQRDLWGERGFWRGESVLTMRDGKKINAMMLLKAVTNEQGEKIGWLGVYTDISFLRLNEQLQAANNYLEQLAFISAHDIKSPIVTLQGLTDLMTASKNMHPDDLHVLKMQKNVIQQMQAINQALNEILKLRQKLKIKDKSETENEPVPLKMLIDNITGLFENEIKQAGAKVEIEIDPLASLPLQQIYFQSLFYNLFSNAIKYRDAFRPLEIKFTGRKADSDTIQFIMEDNGLGFDMVHNRKRLFGMFKRFHNHVEGTGVGLHMVKSIVDAFGGTIDVESQPGKGTRFEITFKVGMLG